MNANSELFKIKRDSLQTFVKEQLIGPEIVGEKGSEDGQYIEDGQGAFEGRFGFENGNGDIVDATPGTIYCSGILFPKKESSKSNDIIIDTSNVSENMTSAIVVNDPSEDESDIVDDDTPLDDSDDEKQITQRFPNIFGLSCCLNKSQISAPDLSIYISGRHYTKILGEDILKLFVNVPKSQLPVVESLATSSPLNSYFRIDNGRLYLIITDSNQYSAAKSAIDDIDRNYAETIATSSGSTDPCYRPATSTFRRMLTSYKDKVYETFKTEPKSNHASIVAKIDKIERYESALAIFRLLLPAIQPNSYGFWKAYNFRKKVNLDGIDLSLDSSKKRIMSSDYPNQLEVVSIPIKDDTLSPLQNQKASLSVSLQLFRDNRNCANDRVYIKVLVENSSSPFIESNSLYYSIATEGVNLRSFFGVRIEVDSENLTPYKFESSYNTVDEETEMLDYLYRNIEDYGIGHMCSVGWDNTRPVQSVWSNFLPSYDIPEVDTEPQKIINSNNGLTSESRLGNPDYLKFKWLSTLSNTTNEEIIDGLNEFVDRYRDWINTVLVDSNPEHDPIVGKIKAGCEKDRNRLKSNIKMLSNANSMQAFRLMNTAMFMQLWHTRPENQQQARAHTSSYNSLDEDFYAALSDEVVTGRGPAKWRAFQLAFIILNIDGIIQNPVDTDWSYRNNIVDLVWFPTGGGKTEAYLGIIAFTIINRRLSNNARTGQGDGTTAIMRYTLRLLATQQFQRATKLIMALEQIRQWETYPLGDDRHRITIGLFVGDALPNSKNDNSRDNPGLVQEADRWEAGATDTKVPFVEHICPWCGSEMHWDSANRVFTCSDPFCAFGSTGHPIPTLLCDEDIYKEVPTLLFGTVDKFAVIAKKVHNDKNKDSRRLFSNVDGLSPDLIIQDELHLLQGPLGSAVGLFECAIDALCTRNISGPNGNKLTVRPKIVSSTATTRNTELQIRALYDREVNIFPKNGINYDDSFFAFFKRQKSDVNLYSSKRRYIGVMPTGRTAMYMQIRLASCIFTHRALFERDFKSDPDFNDVANYYFSLISYFGSLRDVGTTDAQFLTEFPKYVRQIFHRVIIPGGMLSNLYASNSSFTPAELTGRLSGNEVVNTLGRVQTDWSMAERLPFYDSASHKQIAAAIPPDFIMATNMISVGIDVSRFNTMLINSMPRNKAEYIQASSRVARETLGVVFTLHNPFRSRDVSHFEKFKEFHEKLYYYVEPISITPFSTKTIKMFMPLCLATYMRHKSFGVSLNSEVRKITPAIADKIKGFVYDYFNARLDKVPLTASLQIRGILTTKALAEIQTYLDVAFKEWIDKININDNNRSPLYFYKEEQPSLFVPIDAYEEEKNNSNWVIQSSVRIIESESILSVIE